MTAPSPARKTAKGGAAAALLPDGRRLHLNHGPIDLIIEAFGAPGEVRLAYRQAMARFEGILGELVAELPLLRQPLRATHPLAKGTTARRMVEACWPYRAKFITPMAAVAGAVAEEMLEALVAGRDLARAYVNDGGDIAFHLAPGQYLRAGIVADPRLPSLFGKLALDAAMPVRGIATSGRATKGQGGRSFSLGIADSVTVLAVSGAAADAAATMIANEVDSDHPAIRRVPACELDPDSDLGEISVTIEVGRLPRREIDQALEAGARVAEALREAGQIYGAVLTLSGAYRVVGCRALGLPAPQAA